MTTVALDGNLGFARGLQPRPRARGRAGDRARQPRRRADRRLAARAGRRRRCDGRGPSRLLAPLVLSPDVLSEQDTVHPPSRPRDLPICVRSLFVPRMRSSRGRSANRAMRRGGRRSPRARRRWAVGCALVGSDRDRCCGWGRSTRRSSCTARTSSSACARRSEGVEIVVLAGDARVVHHRAHSSLRAFGGEPFERLAPHPPRGRRSGDSDRDGGRRSTIAAQAVSVRLADGGSNVRSGVSAERERQSAAARCGRATSRRADGSPEPLSNRVTSNRR